MPHLFKDIDPALLQLLDRSPVQTPVQTASNSPTTSTSSTPTASPQLGATNPSIPLPINISLNSPIGTPILRPTTPVDHERNFTAKEFKGKDADRVSHLDRSPVQTAYQTRASSQPGRTPRMHGWEEAEETIRVLRMLVERGMKNKHHATNTNGCDGVEEKEHEGDAEDVETEREVKEGNK
ncbi:MAG: hypothetical protein Q9217_004352 [Psora testacea]